MFVQLNCLLYTLKYDYYLQIRGDLHAREWKIRIFFAVSRLKFMFWLHETCGTSRISTFFVWVRQAFTRFQSFSLPFEFKLHFSWWVLQVEFFIPKYDTRVVNICRFVHILLGRINSARRRFPLQHYDICVRPEIWEFRRTGVIKWDMIWTIRLVFRLLFLNFIARSSEKHTLSAWQCRTFIIVIVNDIYYSLDSAVNFK